MQESAPAKSWDSISKSRKGNQDEQGDTTNIIAPLLTVAGLEVLQNIEVFFVQLVDKFPPQTVISSEVPINRRYNVMNIAGDKILAVGEVVDYRSRCWRGMQRRYCMYIFSMEGQLLLTSERQRVRCCTRSPPVQEAEIGHFYSEDDQKLHATRVHLTNGDFIGQIRDVAYYDVTPKFSIDDETCSNIMTIQGKARGNFCTVCSCKNNIFTLLDRQHNRLGEILKTMELLETNSGSVKICFGANFPNYLHPVTKALILAAVFDLNISYFERRCATNLIMYVVQLTAVLFFVIGSVIFLLWAIKVLEF